MSEQTIDTFWGRCSVKTPEEIAASPFKIDRDFPQPHWREDNTCSHCGGLRPSLVLAAIREGRVSVEPTDKNYKIYIRGESLSSGCPANKCYLNHFSESQAVEFVQLAETGKMKIETPGYFYSGLCFGIYKESIRAVLEGQATKEKAHEI